MATRADVARLAGVSPSTVSYALSGQRPIAEATRARIQAAMEELGYQPNAMAAGLAGGRSRIIAMLFPSLERGYTDSDLEYLVGAADVARGLGYRVLLWTMDRRDTAEVVDLNRSGLVEGVLLMEVLLHDERVASLVAADVPCALIGRTADPSHTPFADRDFASVGRMAVAHLAGLGHRNVAYIGAAQRQHDQGFGAVVRAEAGVSAAAEDLGMVLHVLRCEATVAAGRDALVRLRSELPQVTGVIAFNDEATAGLFQGAHAHGLVIPEDLSVITTSLSSQRANFLFPPITAVSPPGGAIGGAAARMLIHQLRGQPDPETSVLMTGPLVERASTAPPRRRTRRIAGA